MCTPYYGRNSLPTATVYTATWMTLINNVGPREPDTQSTYCRIQFVQFKGKTQAQLRMLSEVRRVVTFGKVINGGKHTREFWVLVMFCFLSWVLVIKVFCSLNCSKNFVNEVVGLRTACGVFFPASAGIVTTIIVPGTKRFPHKLFSTRTLPFSPLS